QTSCPHKGLDIHCHDQRADYTEKDSLGFPLRVYLRIHFSSRIFSLATKPCPYRHGFTPFLILNDYNICARSSSAVWLLKYAGATSKTVLQPVWPSLLMR